LSGINNGSLRNATVVSTDPLTGHYVNLLHS